MIHILFSILWYLLIFLGGAISLFYLFSLNNYRYWTRRKVYQVPPSFPFGNLAEANFKKPVGIVTKEIYDQTKDMPFVGTYFFWEPVLYINDPELIKQIFVKDFNHFQDRGIYVNEKIDPLSGHMFAVGSPLWKTIRQKLSPTFTSGKMKMMFPILVENSDKLVQILNKPASQAATVEMKDLMARFSTDIIASCAFGIQANSMEDPNSEFRAAGKKVLEKEPLEAMMDGFLFMAPTIAKFFNMRVTPQSVENFFLRAVREAFDYRINNKVERKDFMQLLIQLHQKGYVDDGEESPGVEKTVEKLTFDQAAAQAFVFFLGGFETSSTTLQYIFFELAQHPEMQEKARKEIDEVLAKNNGKFTYEGLMDLKYVEQIINETLRKYPPLPLLQRQCNKRYQIPNSQTFIEKDILVFIPVYGLHMDPQYWPNPEKFDPDRFTEENKSSRPHFAYLPFGEGPRNCIGMRFGMMQTKIGMATILAHYNVEISEKTQLPLKFDPAHFIFQPLGGEMNLKLTMRN